MINVQEYIEAEAIAKLLLYSMLSSGYFCSFHKDFIDDQVIKKLN